MRAVRSVVTARPGANRLDKHGDALEKGLREAGWRPDRALVRFGYAAFAALKYGGVLPWLIIGGDASSIAAWAQGGGRPLEELLYEPLALMAYLLDLLDEACELAAPL